MHCFIDENPVSTNAVRLKMKNDMRNPSDFIAASQEEHIFLLA